MAKHYVNNISIPFEWGAVQFSLEQIWIFSFCVRDAFPNQAGAPLTAEDGRRWEDGHKSCPLTHKGLIWLAQKRLVGPL